MYYLAGKMKGLSLFFENSLRKFISLIFFLAIISEIFQLWVPERVFNLFDLIANLAGMVVGVGVIRMAQGSGGKGKRDWVPRG